MTLRGASRILLVLTLGSVCLAACRASRRYVPAPGPYDAVSPEVTQRLGFARERYDAGELESARELLGELAFQAPRHLGIGIFLQEVELASLSAGQVVRGIEPSGNAQDDQARLLRVYERRALEVPTSEGFVLAARLARDRERSLQLIERALELDPRNPWGHYARAFQLAALLRTGEARAALERALEIDPGHGPSIRLDAHLLAAEGELEASQRALEVWVERSEDDPTVDPSWRVDAKIDLAVLAVAAEEPAVALSLLSDLDTERDTARVRATLVRAAALADLGDEVLALSAVRQAAEHLPEDPRILVQEAQLLERGGIAPERERQLWQRVLDIAAEERAQRALEPQPEHGLSPLDFRSLLIQLQAHTRLERLSPSSGGGGSARS